MSVQEYMTFDDLQGVDSSLNGVREAFSKEFGKTPDGICVNKETYFNAVKPAITERYGYYCYKRLGQYEFTSDDVEPPQQAIVGSNTAINQGDSSATIQLTVNGSWSDSTGYTSSVTTGMNFSTQFDIEGAFKMGTEFSISVTAGSSHSSSVSRSASSSVSVTVPPRSKVKVDMTADMKKEKLAFKVPIEISGMFGANFPNPVKGHYFWFLDARTVLPKTSGEITGVINGTRSFAVQTIIRKAEPL